MADLPTVIGPAGLQPQSPSVLLAQLIAGVTATNPGYTANLPASLIEDVSSTEVAGLAQIDSSRVEFVNSLTPLGANDFLLYELGQIAGVPLGLATNTSVLVVFSGSPGFVLGVGFTIGDGTYQYTLTDGGIIGASGSTLPLFALATISGTWSVAPGTVNNLITSIPTEVGEVTVTNPLAGTPGNPNAETSESYRSRVLQASLAQAQGMSKFLKTLLNNVPGVQPRLVSVLQTSNGWEVICGGGDPYQVAYAIYQAVGPGIASLTGSQLLVTNITQANPGVVTTALNHNLVTGAVIQINGVVGMVEVNGTSLTATVLSEKSFSIVNTSGFLAYVSGGIITPNPKNQLVSINDYPDTYAIPFVVPPLQNVTINVTWNTTATNFVSGAAIAQAGQTALAAYVNNLPTGVPINTFELTTVFQAAIADILPPQLLTRLLFSVNINGVTTAPLSGTGIIQGDPESYFSTTEAGITISQG